MAHIRIETSVRTHKKFLAAGPAACWLYACGLMYCQDTLTDGHIPASALDMLGVKGLARVRRLATELVTAGLWKPTADGWVVHDYLKHNKSAEEVRDIKVERREAGSKGGLQKASNSKQFATANENGLLYPLCTGTALDPVLGSGEKEQRPAFRSAPLHTPHRAHAHCGRICLPGFLFDEFVRRRSHDDADMEVRDWCLEIERVWGKGGPRGREETGEPIAFWRARYAEKWPAVQAASASREPQWVLDARARKAASDGTR